MGEYTLPYTGDELVGILSNAGGGGIPIGGLVQASSLSASNVIEDSSGTYLRSGILTDDPEILALHPWNYRWIDRGNIPTDLFYLAYNGSIFVGVSSIANTAASVTKVGFDGTTTWTARTTGAGGNAVGLVSVGSTFVLASSASPFIRYSTDAVTWQTATNPFGTTSPRGIVQINNRLVLFTATQVAESSDGINWTLRGTMPSGLS